MSWNKISIGQGQAIIAANALDPIDRDITILHTLKKKPVEYYESLPEYMLKEQVKKTAWISKLPDGKYPAPFWHRRYYYKMKVHPNQLSKQEFALLQKYAGDYVENLHYIMALLSTKYTLFGRVVIDTDFEKRAQLFKSKMPFGIAYGYALFFSTYYPHLLQIGLAYSQGVKEAAEKTLSSFG